MTSIKIGTHASLHSKTVVVVVVVVVVAHTPPMLSC